MKGGEGKVEDEALGQAQKNRRYGEASVVIQMKAPAKVNLYLGVHELLDERGYHRVDTIMAGINVYDEVCIEPANKLSVLCDPPANFPQEKNTAYKAARLLGKAVGKDPKVRITIKKGIPEQGGLGGSSTDAATVLLAICKMWDMNPREQPVVEVAKKVGADVPFFLNPVTSLYTGAGDTLAEKYPEAPSLPMVVVRAPGPGVSTKAAYDEFDAGHVNAGGYERMRESLIKGTILDVANSIENNLGEIACRINPAARTARGWLRGRKGVLSCEVSGSGSCVFGICESLEAASLVAEEAEEQSGWWAVAAQTLNGEDV